MDWLVSGITLVNIYLFQRQRLRLANSIGVVNCILWTILAVRIRQWGMLPLNFALIAMYSHGLWRLRKGTK